MSFARRQLREYREGQWFQYIDVLPRRNLSPIPFTMQVNTTEGTLTVPQFGSVATLDGRESQIIVTEYAYGKHKLKYSTAEVSRPLSELWLVLRFVGLHLEHYRWRRQYHSLR